VGKPSYGSNNRPHPKNCVRPSAPAVQNRGHAGRTIVKESGRKWGGDGITQEIPDFPLALSTDRISIVQSVWGLSDGTAHPATTIADEFERLSRGLPGLSDADRQAIIRQTTQLTKEMTCLLEERRLRRRFTQFNHVASSR
jgi:hypothetical protein